MKKKAAKAQESLSLAKRDMKRRQEIYKQGIPNTISREELELADLSRTDRYGKYV